MTTIALVDDEPNILKSLKRAMRGRDWQVLTFESPQSALAALPGQDVDLIISDYKMPTMNGVAFLNEAKQCCPKAMRMILSGQADLDGMLGAINSAQVFRFILKPWNDEELLITIAQALEYQRLQQENQALLKTVESQSHTLKAQLLELQRLESLSPGITQVSWDADGSIDLSSEYQED